MKVRRESKRNEFSGLVVIRSIIENHTFREVVQLARTPVLGTGGRRFESCLPDHMTWKANGKATPTAGECVICII